MCYLRLRDIPVGEVARKRNVCFVDKGCQNAVEKEQEVINLRMFGTVKVGASIADG